MVLREKTREDITEARVNTQIMRCLDTTELHLILLPTEQCNFRCTYCYESFPVERMRADVVEGVKALIAARGHDLRRLELGWFGGEPLLAKRIILDVCRYAHQLASEHSQLIYGASITTNGYLLDVQTARELTQYGVKLFHISLDGPPEIHDKSRVKVNGKGSFARIWSNLLALKGSNLDFIIALRIHYSPATYLELIPLIELINTEFARDSRYSVYFKDIERLGGTSDDSIRLFTERANDEIQSLLTARLDPRIRVYSEERDGPYVCYASRANSFVVRPNGTLGKCTVALYDDRNSVGQLLPDGTLQIDQDKLRPWLVGLNTGHARDLGCPYSALNDGFKPPKDREDVHYLPIVSSK